MAGAAQPFDFTSDGLRVAALKQGHGDPVVIIHGLGGHKEDFAAVMTALSAHYSVYAFDMIGFGHSDRRAASVTIGMQVQAVRDLVAASDLGKVRLVGNSLGGWVAAAFAAKHPDLVEKLVLIDAAGLRVTMSGPPPVNFAPDTVEEMAALLKAVIASPFAHSADFVAQALASFKAGGEAVTLEKLFSAFASPTNTDRLLDDVLPDIGTPTLVVWGAEDGLFPAVLADVVAGGIAGAGKVLIPGASHFPQIDKPDELAAILVDFLR